ncbi:MAG: tRNA lysidine(34) synthetase TilS [Prevotellaceae bacterium]|jgi:tRNA(Ile)-lysidine synthase|nr:tRNA lysidine(34) synthetase TilS [Prevotellaceae bacterium]
MLSRFKKYILANELLLPADKILVAVSGGVDSVLLLHLLLQAGYELVVLHCNFCLRGAESDGDEQLVSELAAIHNLSFESKRFDTQEYAQKKGISIQMAARELRYDYFQQMAEKHGCSKIAVGHNANDTVETFILNLTRGTGIKGLTGIAARQGNIVRPLLFAAREEILEQARLMDMTFREDSSNTSDKYARNRIRHYVVPELQQLNPSFLQTMQQNLQRMGQYQQIVEQQVQDVKNQACSQNGDELRILIDKLPKENVNLWLYELLCDFGLSADTINNISSLLNATSGKKFYSASHILVKDRGCLIVKKREQVDESFFLEVAERAYPFVVQIKGQILLKFSRIPPAEVDFSEGNTVVFLDYDKLQFPLQVRHWRHGDTFNPLGVNGKKKLSDFFVDRKLSILQKQMQLLLCSEEAIAWIVGLRPDARFAITGKTTQALKVELLA